MTKVGSMSSGTCMCEAGAEGRGAKPRCMIKGRARDEWGRGFFRGAHGVVLVARVREAGICQHNLRVEVREGEAPMTKVGSMSSGTCTCEARAECVRSQDA